MVSKRLRLYYWFLEKVLRVSIGCMPPSWTRIIYGILFPIKFLYWTVYNKEGYQVQSDSWLIHNVSYPDRLFQQIANGDVIKIWKDVGSNNVFIEDIHKKI